MARYWVYIGTKIHGPVDVPSLRKLNGFNLLSQVCLEGEQTWRLADDVIDIKSYFLSPPRVSALPVVIGNTVVAPDPLPSPEEEPTAVQVLETLPEAPVESPAAPPAAEPVRQAAAANAAAPSTTETAAAKSPALRALCEICGYKNPRGVRACMKCGTPIAAAASPESETKTSAEQAPAPAEEAALLDTPIEPPAEKSAWAWPLSPRQWAIAGSVLAAVVLLVGGSLWLRSRAKHKRAPVVPAPVIAQPAAAPAPKRAAARVPRKPAVSRLPGVSAKPEEASSAGEDSDSVPARQPAKADDQAEPAYRIISDAAPIKARHSSPLDSPYATKRRGDQSLWTASQAQAIRQVQRARIYGGQRTIQRNTDILLQLLRDREYTTAFESGKRLYLFNDLDWSASIKDGPVYEVRLSFSGGREDDGTPRKPLRFAFNADLERGTVEPGGEDQVRSNSLHAFFDESRIPPEERRAIAKDVEELVLAADPAGSPLALDTVVRNFVATYNTAALERVANAFGLDTVKKKLKHDPRLGRATGAASASSPATPPAKAAADPGPARLVNVTPEKARDVQADEAAPAKPKAAPAAATREGSNFEMQHASGRERTLQASVVSTATPDRLWEALTGYERFKQFVPDVLESSREGQDGAAVIIHTVSLARWMMLVFKINLHLRIIERPAQRVIEFERLAGDFQSFRGSFEIVGDPATKKSTLVFHATLAPKGRMPDWVLRGMARRFVMTKLDAFRTRAEAN